jgi:uridine kinase
MLIIGIAGGTGSGKTTVVNKIIKKLPEGEVTVISQDAYYRDNSHLPLEVRQELNFDHPEAIELDLLVEDIKKLRRGETIQQPVYSYLTCTRGKEKKIIPPMEVIIIEGILCLSSKELRELMDIKIFVDCEADVRLSRVIQRDLARPKSLPYRPTPRTRPPGHRRPQYDRRRRRQRHRNQRGKALKKAPGARRLHGRQERKRKAGTP